MTYAEEHLIRVRKELSNQAKQLTFYHELVHAILFSMGETNHEEKYVEAFGAYLHQFEKTRQ